MRSLFQNKFGINSKIAAANIVLVANALVWYLVSLNYLKTNVSENDVISIVEANLVAIILAAIISIYIIRKIENRLKFLIYWTVIGVFLSIVPLSIQAASLTDLLVVSAVMGAYFGVGLPVFMGYYAASTETENRARLSGITIFIIGILAVVFENLGGSDATTVTIILTVWRTFGLVSIIFLNPPDVKINKKEKVSYKGLLKSGPLLLYFAPWLMFSLINNFAFPILDNLHIPNYTLVENILAGISAIFFGFIADYIGRKRLLLSGFALIGLGYAALGLFSESPITQLFYTFADGIAFGIFTTLFLLVIWGDLADKKDSEKYYLIGFIPFLLSTFLQLSIGQLVAGPVSQSTYIFSFASFFLFAAVLPLYLAPETLPEKAMKDRNLKSYLEKAQKIAEKEISKKRNDNEQPEEKQEAPEIQEQKNNQEYDEAKKLAEQYY